MKFDMRESKIVFYSFLILVLVSILFLVVKLDAMLMSLGTIKQDWLDENYL
jgi:hypothetical protein